MIRILEEYLIKKINVARMLNLYGKNMSKELLMEKTKIPSTSLNRYLSDVKHLYESYLLEKEEYSSFYFQEVVKDIVKTSDNMNLLRIIFLYPGNNSDFYKKGLNISDASFYRRLAHLREILQDYNCDISANKGYRIESSDEFNARFVLGHMAFFFSWDLEEKCTACKKVFQKLDSSKLNYYDKSNEEMEDYFFEIIFAVSTMRDMQKFYISDKEGRPILSFDLNKYFFDLYNECDNEMNHKIKKYYERLSKEDLENTEKLEMFESCFSKAYFHDKLYPYDSSEMPVRRLAFVDTFHQTVPKLYDRVDSLINQVFKDIEIDISSKRISLIYWIVLKNLFLFDEESKQILYVYTDYGKVHLQYLVDKLNNFNQFFNNRLLIQPLHSLANIKLGTNDAIATNSMIKSFPYNKQFIINDFFTMENYIQLSEGLIKS